MHSWKEGGPGFDPGHHKKINKIKRCPKLKDKLVDLTYVITEKEKQYLVGLNLGWIINFSECALLTHIQNDFNKAVKF